MLPSKIDLEVALKSASEAHHNYQTIFLGGKHDPQWPGWYAAYVLGRLGDFISASKLSKLLNDSPGSEEWNKNTARYLLEQINSKSE